MPRLALPKGRLAGPAAAWLATRGIAPPEVPGRSLTVDLGRGWEAILLKGPDVPVFVQNGAADLGIVGSDVLEEDRPDVYDLAALGFGRCRFSLAAPPGWSGEAGEGPVVVATKYPRWTERLLGAAGLWVRVIHVSSSAELAPGLGLGDAVADIVDSGRTLRENGLEERRVLASVEAHLVANRRSYRFLQDRFWE